VYIEPTGWWVIAEQPYSEALKKRVRHPCGVRCGFLLVGLVLAFVASYLLARRVLRRPSCASRWARNASARVNSTPRIDMSRSGDEIGMLALEFNRMADQLQDYTTGP